MNQPRSEVSFNFEHTYADQLPEFFDLASPTPVAKPGLLQFNRLLAQELGLDIEKLTNDAIPQIFSGNALPSDAKPIAQAYAGHQFGGFSPQLGDGRALLLGEVIDQQGRRRDIALKGSGRTPFSRGGDGKAAVGPVLREYLIGEAMHALGIPTTRALAAISTGEPVMRERPLPGAVLARVAASHVRVGTFQFFAARGQTEQVEKLANYVIARHFPEVSEDSNRYQSLLKSVMDRQAKLIASWMLVGFIHGVMNTDNMAISGETIDYGPCAFMDSYDPQTVFSSIDRHGRYAFENQPKIALWNLARFAETLLPLIDGDDSDRAISKAMSILENFLPTYEEYFYKGAWAKLGLAGDAELADSGNSESVSDSERELIDDWLELLRKNDADYTLAWRHLASAAEDNPSGLGSMFQEESDIDAWLERWKNSQNGTQPAKIALKIRSTNPIYIPRNHLVEDALSAATDNDLEPFESLLAVLQNPFDENPQFKRYAEPAPKAFTACYKTFCGT